MNKRQRKKNRKKEEMFVTSFVNSYKDLKIVDRARHECEVSMRRRPYDSIWDMYLDEFEDMGA